MHASTASTFGLAALLTGAGATHFAIPAVYDAMIPEPLPGSPRTWTLGVGAAEIAVGLAVAVPATRGPAGLAAAALFAGVLPANVKTALDARTSSSTPYRVGTILRLPAQLPLIAWALHVRRCATR